MAMNYEGRDLWWVAREKSRRRYSYKGLRNLLGDTLFTLQGISRRASPTRRVFNVSAITQRPDVVFMPDFNKYRKRDLRHYIDAGCKAFMFRIGGPTQWVQGLHKWAIDETYKYYIEQAAKYGVLEQTIGYIVHSAFEPWTVNGATGETLHTELIDEWTSGGWMPAAFCYDHEVSRAWTSTGTPIDATGHNLVTSLAENTANTYRKFKRAVSIYSAKWFMNQTADYWTWHDTYFSNVNKPESMGGAGKQRPLIMAWYGQAMTKTYSHIDQVSTDLFVPDPAQVARYLWAGYEGDAWQFTSTLRLTGDDVGVDCNISLVDAKTFYLNFGLKEPGVVAPPPPPPPAGDLAARVKVLEDGQDVLDARIETVAGQVRQAGAVLRGEAA